MCSINGSQVQLKCALFRMRRHFSLRLILLIRHLLHQCDQLDPAASETCFITLTVRPPHPSFLPQSYLPAGSWPQQCKENPITQVSDSQWTTNSSAGLTWAHFNPALTWVLSVSAAAPKSYPIPDLQHQMPPSVCEIVMAVTLFPSSNLMAESLEAPG